MEFNKKMRIDVKKSFDKGLYVAATPIGNLGDISRRALDLFASADFIICEDKRVSGKLLSYYEIKTPMISYHDHNSQAVMPKLIDALKAGKTLALITDAGTPLISDPGYKLVNECRNQGIMVTSLPGASAILCALTCAGMATDKFFFSGFLPSKTVARKKEINKLSTVPATLVYFESPKRLLASLKDLREVLGNRNAAVCRELTKLYEEVKKDNLDNLIAHYESLQTPKGEIVLLIEQGEEKQLVNDLDSALVDALKKLSVKEAVAAVTYMTGKKRKEVYKRALELSDNC